MSKSRFSVRTGGFDITILYDGKEVLYWDLEEWKEDAKLVINIAEAIRQAYEEPKKLYDWLVQEGKIS